MRQIEKFSTKSDKMWFTKWDPGWISRLWYGRAEGNFLVQFQFQFISFCGAQKCHLPDINSLCIGDGGKRRVDGGGLSKSWQLTKRSTLTWVDIEWTLINCDLSGHGEEGGDPESHPRRHSLRVEPEVHLQPQSWVMEMSNWWWLAVMVVMLDQQVWIGLTLVPTMIWSFWKSDR